MVGSRHWVARRVTVGRLVLDYANVLHNYVGQLRWIAGIVGMRLHTVGDI